VFVCPMLFFSGYKTAPCRKFLELPNAPVVSDITPLPQDTFVGVYSSAAILWLNLPAVRNVAFVPSGHLVRSNEWNGWENNVPPLKVIRDEPYACTCRSMPRQQDPRWAKLGVLSPLQSL
jgi:hypothetical protein